MCSEAYVLHCRQVARPWHAFAVRNLPWLQVAKSYALHHGRLYRQWALICQNMRSQPPPTSDDVSIAAALRRIKSAKTGTHLPIDYVNALSKAQCSLDASFVYSLCPGLPASCTREGYGSKHCS